LIFSKKKKIFFNFYFEINIEPIEVTTKNINKKIKNLIGVFKIVFLIKNSHIILVLSTQKKMEKIQKNDFWGLCPGLKCGKMDPKNLKKKTLLHIVPRT